MFKIDRNLTNTFFFLIEIDIIFLSYGKQNLDHVDLSASVFHRIDNMKFAHCLRTFHLENSRTYTTTFVLFALGRV